MLVVIIVVVFFALVVQYNRNKGTPISSNPASSNPASSNPVSNNLAPQHRKHEGFTSHAPVSKAPASTHSQKNPESNSQAPNMINENVPRAPALKDMVNPAPFESLDTEMYRAIDYKPEANSVPQPSSFPKDRLTKADLLPADAANTKWAQVNPAGQGDLENVNLLDAGWNFGIDTQGQTLKNPNLQLRSEFPNPKADTGPWNMSTIENDCSRRYFEIGQP